MINDNIDPVPVLKAVIERIKYVDDFNDIVTSDWADAIVDAIRVNITHLLRQSTSVGLKLNDSKSKFLFLNMSKDEIIEVLRIFYPDDKIDEAYEEVLKYTHKLLGFEFSVRNNQVNVSAAVGNIINRLNASCRLVSSMRKSGNSLERT